MSRPRIRKLLSLAMRLYPRAWRDRYAVEFEATLDDMPHPGWTTLRDIVKGAIAMQLQLNGKSAMKGAAAFGLAGMLAAGALSFAIPNRYLSSAAVEAVGAEPQAVAAAVTNSISKERVQALMDKHKLFPGEQPVSALGHLKRNIRVSPVMTTKRGRNWFRVEFVHGDPVTAQTIATELTDTILQEHARAATSGKLTLLDSASRPRTDQPIYPNRFMVAFTGLLAGTLIGAVWALAARRRHALPS